MLPPLAIIKYFCYTCTKAIYDKTRQIKATNMSFGSAGGSAKTCSCATWDVHFCTSCHQVHTPHYAKTNKLDRHIQALLPGATSIPAGATRCESIWLHDNSWPEQPSLIYVRPWRPFCAAVVDPQHWEHSAATHWTLWPWFSQEGLGCLVCLLVSPTFETQRLLQIPTAAAGSLADPLVTPLQEHHLRSVI